MTVIWCRTFSNSIHATHTNTIFKFIVGSIYLCLWPWARSHLHSVGPCPSHASFTARSSCPYMHGNSSLLGTNVTIHDHLSHSAPLACEGIPSIDFGIFNENDVNFNICNLTRCCHIGFQRGRVPTQVRARGPSNEGGVGGAGQPNEDVNWPGACL